MNNDTPSKRSDVIAEEAAEYFVALQTPDAKTKAEFIDWLKVSPEHVNEFLAVAALWDTLPKVSAQPSAEELIQLAAGDQNVVALAKAQREDWSNVRSKSGGLDQQVPLGDAAQERRSSTPARESPARGGALQRARSPRLWASAASIVLAVAAAALYLQNMTADDYATALGEQTSIPLPDGSIVTLNTLSSIQVDYSEAFRVIHLVEGEALFEVSKDPERPFRVIAGSAVIQAVGTQFNVRSVAAEDVTVTVVEGIVDVSAKPSRNSSGDVGRLSDAGEPALAAAIEPIRLTVGQQARIESRSGQVAVIEVPAVEKAIAWQQRRLVFEHLSLKEVIDEFNRYNDPPIVIDDPELRNLPISGVFRSNDRESFVQFLSQMKLAESHMRADGTIALRSVPRDP